MSLIKVEDLTFSYPSSFDNVFENVSFSIDTDWRLGFGGRNGRGKTTFLNLLQGKYEYSGKIISSVQFDYFPYEVSDKAEFTSDILHKVAPNAEDWELMRELSYLEVDDDVLWRPFDTLSNGEQTKVLLAALFLNEGHFLLIDEPTNHLDTAAREMVAKYLNRKKGFILVSHDRCFLDGCVDHILSINKSNIEVQSGNFTDWFEGFSQRQAAEFAQNARLRKDIGRLQQSAARTANWSERVERSKIGADDKGFVGHKAAKMMKRSKAIEARKMQAIEQKQGLLKNAEYNESLKISPIEYHSDLLVKLDGISVKYDGMTVNEPISFDIRKKERIALDGKNGCGKSSILKLIAGHNIAHSGVVTVGSGLIISYLPQDTSHLKGDLTDFAYENGIDESLFKAILRKMSFERVQFEKDMSDYSGGQKKKVLIAKSLCEKAHLYIWDEPLNFIDVYSRMQIEELLLEFSPTMIFVEHDSAFKQIIATKTVTM